MVFAINVTFLEIVIIHSGWHALKTMSKKTDWINFISFSNRMVTPGCLCHIILKQGIPGLSLPLLMWSSSQIIKEINCKSLLGFEPTANREVDTLPTGVVWLQ